MTRTDLDYRMTDIFSRHGAFFAFSKEQFREQSKAGVKYSRISANLICPADSADAMLGELDAAIEAFHQADLAENGRKAIIWRELANHEAQISMDTSDTVAALAGYGITAEEVETEWPGCFQHCVENDLF